MIASVVSDISSAVTAVVAVLVFVTALRAKRGVDAVAEKASEIHREVKTQNGLTIAALQDRAEGRRIEADIPHDARTSSEQHYVEQLNDPTVNPGE